MVLVWLWCADCMIMAGGKKDLDEMSRRGTWFIKHTYQQSYPLTATQFKYRIFISNPA